MDHCIDRDWVYAELHSRRSRMKELEGVSPMSLLIS
jgi:hypothetical protein